MAPKFNSRIYEFGSGVVVPAHIESDLVYNPPTRDPTKFTILEEPTGTRESESRIVAWDIGDAEEASAIAEGRWQFVCMRGGAGIVRLQVEGPNGELTPYPPLDQEVG